MARIAFPLFISIALIATLLLAGCSMDGVQSEQKYPTGRDGQANEGDIYSKPESIFGNGGLKVLNSRDKEDGGTDGIGVNSFLWRASLDTVSFMPLASADPFGGVILTDWYQPDENVDERFKINVFILSRQLRSDGVSVKVFKQELKKGTWIDLKTGADTARQLEDSILTRARQLRVAKLGGVED